MHARTHTHCTLVHARKHTYSAKFIHTSQLLNDSPWRAFVLLQGEEETESSGLFSNGRKLNAYLITFQISPHVMPAEHDDGLLL